MRYSWSQEGSTNIETRMILREIRFFCNNAASSIGFVCDKICTAMLSLALYRYCEGRFWVLRKVTKHLFIDPGQLARRRQNNLCIVLICRNVEDYIDEWIRYHELAGVDHFYIYDNGSTDATTTKASSHNAGNGVTVVVHPWKLNTTAGACPVSPQETSYVHAVLNYKHRHRWMAFIDIDEFLVPSQHLTVAEALGHLSEFSNISLPWRQFGHCGHITKPLEPCLFAYTLRHQQKRYRGANFKCILDPSKISKVAIHEFCTTDMGKNTANDKGQVEPINAKQKADGFISSEYLQLNHYRTKSIEESDAKIKLVMYGELAEERKHRTKPQIKQLSTNVIEDTVALDFLNRHGIKNCQEYIQYINGNS